MERTLTAPLALKIGNVTVGKIKNLNVTEAVSTW